MKSQEYLASLQYGAPGGGVGVNADRMDPEFANRLAALIQAAEAETGDKVSVFEGYRDPARSAQLRANYTGGPVEWKGTTYRPQAGVKGYKAAGPMKSEHNYGLAADIRAGKNPDKYPSGPAYDYMTKHASEFGLHWFGSSDPAHFEIPPDEFKLALAGKPLKPFKNYNPNGLTPPGDIPRIATAAPNGSAVDAINSVAPRDPMSGSSRSPIMAFMENASPPPIPRVRPSPPNTTFGGRLPADAMNGRDRLVLGQRAVLPTDFTTGDTGSVDPRMAGMGAPQREPVMPSFQPGMMGRSSPEAMPPLPRSRPSPPAPGMIASGNIDLNNRPVYFGNDGTYGTERSFSIGTDRGEVLIPQIVNGKLVSQAEAIKHYQDTGENMGTFQSPAAADAYATKTHERDQGLGNMPVPMPGRPPALSIRSQPQASTFRPLPTAPPSSALMAGLGAAGGATGMVAPPSIPTAPLRAPAPAYSPPDPSAPPQVQAGPQGLFGNIGAGLGNALNYVGEKAGELGTAMQPALEQSKDAVIKAAMMSPKARGAIIDPYIARMFTDKYGMDPATKYGATFGDRQFAAQNRDRLSQGLPPLSMPSMGVGTSLSVRPSIPTGRLSLPDRSARDKADRQQGLSDTLKRLGF